MTGDNADGRTCGWAEKLIKEQINTYGGERERETNRHTDTQTDRQADRQTGEREMNEGKKGARS